MRKFMIRRDMYTRSMRMHEILTMVVLIRDPRKIQKSEHAYSLQCKHVDTVDYIV